MGLHLSYCFEELAALGEQIGCDIDQDAI